LVLGFREFSSWLLVLMHLGRTSWWQEHGIEEVLHLMVKRKMERKRERKRERERPNKQSSKFCPQ
jgi:hypothetical protein